MLRLLAWLLLVPGCAFGLGLVHFSLGLESNGLWCLQHPPLLCWGHMIVSDGPEWWADDLGRVRPNPCVAPGMGINIAQVIAHALLRTRSQLQASWEAPWPGQQGTRFLFFRAVVRTPCALLDSGPLWCNFHWTKGHPSLVYTPRGQGCVWGLSTT